MPDWIETVSRLSVTVALLANLGMLIRTHLRLRETERILAETQLKQEETERLQAEIERKLKP
jgi:hypothetical protein